MAAFYHHFKNESKYPSILLSINPLLGCLFETTNIEAYAVNGDKKNTLRWLRMMAEDLFARKFYRSSDAFDVITITRCYNTIIIPEAAIRGKVAISRQVISLNLRVNDIPHYVQMEYDTLSGPARPDPFVPVGQIDPFFHWSKAWRFWQDLACEFEQLGFANSFQRAELMKHMYIKPNGDVIYQREVDCK